MLEKRSEEHILTEGLRTAIHGTTEETFDLQFSKQLRGPGSENEQQQKRLHRKVSQGH